MSATALRAVASCLTNVFTTFVMFLYLMRAVCQTMSANIAASSLKQAQMRRDALNVFRDHAGRTLRKRVLRRLLSNTQSDTSSR